MELVYDIPISLFEQDFIALIHSYK